MRIVFDAYWWSSGPPSLRHVVRETVTAWKREYPDDDILVVVRHKDADSARNDVPPLVAVHGTRWWPQALVATVACRWAARLFDADVVYTQNFAASTSRLSAVFIHDVLFVTNPEWFSWIERRYFSLMPRLASKADVVLTSSVTEAERIAGNSRAHRVVPVGIGLSTELIGHDDLDPVAGLAPGRFLLTVGRLNIRKNLANTIAGALRSECVQVGNPLVVVGSANGRSERLPAWAERAVDDGRVRFTGFVSEAQLRWLYSNTSLFLFLSRAEGFGMPSMEALHFGAPMIVSDIAVFREILPTAVPKVHPGDITAISAAIRRVLTAEDAPSERASMTGPHDYNWNNTVSSIRSELSRSLRDRAGPEALKGRP